MGVQINGDTGNISATKADYSGNVTIGGTLTYEDVTNIDSVGLITARSGIKVTSGDIAMDTAGNITLGDSGGATDDRLTFGDGTDLSIYHNGNNSYVKSSTGNLWVGVNNYLNIAGGDDFGTYMARFLDAGAVELYYNHSKKFETTSSGVLITGSNDASDTGIKGDWRFMQTDGTLKVMFDASVSALEFYDNSKAIFGDGDDLSIFHDGGDSVINNNGGNLYINAKTGETAIRINRDADVQLYYDGSKKLETQSAGVKITGKLTFANDNHLNGIELGADQDINLYHDGSDAYFDNGTGDFYIRNAGDNSNQIYISGKGGENGIIVDGDAGVKLYHDNSKTFETNTDGVIVSDDGSNNLNLHTNRFIVNRNEAFYFDQNNTGNSFIFRVSNSSGLDTNALQLYSQGHAYFLSRSPTASSITIRKGVSAADSIDYIQCRANSNSLHLVIEGDGDVKNQHNSYGQVSDIKLKENIVDANSQWNDIKSIKVRNFSFKESSGLSTHTQIGVIAQELETSSPNLVYESIDRDPVTGEDLGTTTKNVKYSILYMKSVKALQEAMARIETLEARLDAAGL